MVHCSVHPCLWDQPYQAEMPDPAFPLGQRVVLTTDFGSDVVTISRTPLPEDDPFWTHWPKAVIVRPATPADEQRIRDAQAPAADALNYCEQQIVTLQLPMKLVSCHYSLDQKKLTFGFVARERIDFRELARVLTRNFQRHVRLQQIGIRDEARLCGDHGPCGRQLCCRSFMSCLNAISAPHGKQPGDHRVSDRLTGVCGRLKCCLSFEINGGETSTEQLAVSSSRPHEHI